MSVDAGTSRIARALRAERDELVALLLRRDGHGRRPGALAPDDEAVLVEEAGMLVDALADALDHDRPLDVHDVDFLRPAIERRAARGDWIEDTTRGLRIVHRTIYERVATIAAETGDSAGVVAVGARLLELIDIASALAGEAWIEARELSRDGGTRRRAALLDLLVAGDDPGAHGLGDLAAELGLGEGTPVLAISARAVRGRDVAGDATMTAAVGALARAGGPPVLPLARLADDEVVVLRPVGADGPDRLVGALERTWRRLADGPVRLAVGISAVHVLPGGAREALADARRARERVPTGGGLLALPSLAPLDWMTLRAGATTWTLVPERVRTFLEEDARDGGQLTHTFRSYLASDLNVKLAARRLHLHANTTRYRLGRIAERTGLDLRRLDDVIALHVATLLHDGRTAAGSGGEPDAGPR
ncbi:helix-turn-helix domain-containing protein [Paraconexibacter antarcticus]|uniref:Helix-turn-helix domain-containing protein n=1 Tax=Paraconexibacter antarcticus TaxID=2949664 RepID=A0ABY5DS53_9ACTN|nr:helix-turn-helix domain-containing protein [Paraconexibacter antarcticus]UTI64270.1 helix-turn-helix domain-containing protein [Paraconexibacter antarcticus]